MNRPDVVEYYHKGKDFPFMHMDSCIVPLKGQFININKVTYKVVQVTYAIDHADDVFERQMRVNIDLEEQKP